MATEEYLATEQPTVHPELVGKLDAKISYLETLKDALQQHDDRLVYELLKSAHYNKLIRGIDHADGNADLAEMVYNIHPELSHFLAQKLIDYLAVEFPFFYYKESEKGVFEIFFGNWWDRRKFGLLDALDLQFIFDEVEYGKLSKSVTLAAEGLRYNSSNIEDVTRANESLQQLIDNQNGRDNEKARLRTEIEEANNTRGGLFNGGKAKEQREELVKELTKLQDEDEKANHAHDIISQNNDEILFYSKEDTILMYEQKSINSQFGSFANFEERTRTLYQDYIQYLINAQAAEGEATNG